MPTFSFFSITRILQNLALNKNFNVMKTLVPSHPIKIMHNIQTFPRTVSAYHRWPKGYIDTFTLLWTSQHLAFWSSGFIASVHILFHSLFSITRNKQIFDKKVEFNPFYLVSLRQLMMCLITHFPSLEWISDCNPLQ